MTLSAYRAKVERLRDDLEREKWYADQFDDYESQQAVEAAREGSARPKNISKRRRQSMHSLMQAIEDIIRANADLERANSAGNLDDIDAAVADMDYYLAQLCMSVGIDKRTMERAA